jgi:hypothetical protein
MPTLVIGLTDLAHKQPLGSGPACCLREPARQGVVDADSLSAAWSDSRRYGRLTVVLSPLLLMVNVPADATGV